MNFGQFIANWGDGHGHGHGGGGGGESGDGHEDTAIEAVTEVEGMQPSGDNHSTKAWGPFLLYFSSS